MLRIRIWIAALVAWLLFLYNIERLYAEINIASFIYILTAIALATVTLVREVQRVGFWLQCGVMASLMIATKAALGYQILGTSLPLTVTELVVIAFTLWLANHVSQSLTQFEASVEDLAIAQAIQGLQEVARHESDLYREVRRAREFGRGVGMVAVGLSETELTRSVHRFVEELQLRMARRFAHARLGEVLLDEFGGTGLVAVADDHFLVLVPEANEQRLDEFRRELRQAVQRRLGVNPLVGSAMFPGEEVTFTGLVERAVTSMHGLAAETDEDQEFVDCLDAKHQQHGQSANASH